MLCRIFSEPFKMHNLYMKYEKAILNEDRHKYAQHNKRKHWITNRLFFHFKVLTIHHRYFTVGVFCMSLCTGVWIFKIGCVKKWCRNIGKNSKEPECNITA